MSLKQKFAMYRECFSLPSEEDRGAYCRQHQIYMADLESWGQEIEESVSADSQSLTLENNQMKGIVAKLFEFFKASNYVCVIPIRFYSFNVNCLIFFIRNFD